MYHTLTNTTMNISVNKTIVGCVRYSVSTLDTAKPANHVIEATGNDKLILHCLITPKSIMSQSPCTMMVKLTLENNPLPFIFEAKLQEPIHNGVVHYNYVVEFTQGVFVPFTGAVKDCKVTLEFGNVATIDLHKFDLIFDVIGKSHKAC